jgi:hypothetical protein
MGELLDGVRRIIAEVPLVPRPGPAGSTAPGARPLGGGVPPAPERPDAEAPSQGAGGASPGDHLGTGAVPPGPWRWRWVWPGPGRPAGMALVAADEALVLWSPGGFAAPGTPPDGRPTPDVAAALARLPELAEASATMEELRAELDRARASAAAARRLLHRAADAVAEEIDRRDDRPRGAPGDGDRHGS